MQKWEYLVIKFGLLDDIYRARYINGQELKDWKKHPHLHELLNQLGADGWEMSGSFSNPGLDRELFFKRPRP